MTGGRGWSAASRKRIEEYWFWSARQNKTGCCDVINGPQNCFKAVGRVKYQIAVTPITVANKRARTTLYAVRCVCVASGTVETLDVLTAATMPGSFVLDGKSKGKETVVPIGWPGQENCGT